MLGIMPSHINMSQNYAVLINEKLAIQDVTGGKDQTSGECSLGQTIPI